MADEVERRIDALYALPLARFTPERDALARELQTAGDREGARRVKALRKPVVAAWALNLLAREDAGGIEELVELGNRLRAAHRRALSGADAEQLREATEERRRLVGRLARRASAILEREGTSAAPHADDVSSTLDAAAVDEEAGRLLKAGRLTKPLRPPAAFGEPGLRVLEGGRRSGVPAPPAHDRDRERAEEARRLERELREAERIVRRASDAVERARTRYEDLERRRADAREALRAAEAEHRGAELERRRLAARLDKVRPSS